MTKRFIRRAAGLVVIVVFGAALPGPAAGAPPAGPPASLAPAVLAGQVQPAPVPAPGFDGPVWAIAFADRTVYIGGEFSHAIVGRQRVPRAGLAAIDASSGALLSWAPESDGLVTALATHDGDVFAAGTFRHIDGVPQDSLARLDGQTGTVRPGWNHLIWGTPYALGVGHGRLYLAGTLSRVGQHQRAGLAAFDLVTGVVDTGWAPTADARVEAVAVDAGRVYLAGRFRRINDVRGSLRVAVVDPVTGALDLSFRAEDATERAYSLAVGPEGPYVAHGGLGGRVRAYDHAGRTRWELTMDGDPVAVARLGDVVYFGGHFDQVCQTARVGQQGTCLDGSAPRVKLGAASGHDGALLPWRADGNGVVGVRVLATAAQQAELAAGGEFTTIAGTTHRRFALFRAAAP